MKTLYLIFLAVAFGAGSATGAGVQTISDIKGTWIQNSENIIEGSSRYGRDRTKPAGEFRLATTRFTFRFEGQDQPPFRGNRLPGE
jgi:hypothetical protein